MFQEKKINFFFQVRRSPANACDQTKFNNWNLLPSYSREIRNGGLAACQSNPPSDGAVIYDDIHGEGRGMDRGSIHTWSAST
jgi:hypothetical protein